ncbi:FecCD family ABC transporter permease [Schauerella aestuarii]|uniref:FecCD family ABC transporter permease n=1 Tax=Schauerella aestuarii TaxID=2511204 RepID=UPI001372023F|nr:iron ABC transporter permease [Achromobacter aestuarii]MYZ44072.1 iron ABC transporter permease [Achromobacter aestuarii]
MRNALILRTRRFSRQINIRTGAVAVLLALVCLAVAVASLAIGKHVIGPIDVANALIGEGPRRDTFIIEILRMPRLLMACMVGMALALSGLILQSVVRNPLASPDILGITGGASAAAVAFLSFLAPVMSLRWLPVAAIVGASTTAAMVYLLAWKQGVSPLRLVLTGVGISALMASVTTLLMVLSPLASTLSAYVWLTGSVFGASWPEVQSMFLWLCALLPALVWVARRVNVLELDDLLAVGLGLRMQTTRLALVALSVALAGSAVAHAGAIAFVGLIAPHIARALVAHTFGGLAVVTALVGAILVAAADLAGRTLFLPMDLPAGMFVSLLGAVFFVYLLLRQVR